MFKKAIIATGILAAGLYSAPSIASPFSANIGWNSEYIFRGIPQEKSSAFGGLDFEAGGFYVGTWGADVGDGLEIDYYGGYNLEVGEFTFGVGGTLYTYTSDFDDNYQEYNLSAGWKWFTFSAAIGSYDNFDGPKLDYQFYSLKAEYAGFYGLVGTFNDDFDGTYYEAGYGNTLTIKETDLFDYSFAVIYSDSTLLGGESDTNLVLTLSKSFDF
ncbi:MAG TPA: TorF family putative porin [Xanthomonadales bacterium]|nr:TorF family putative porin [Xanthomonadales bacterium]